MKKLFSIVMTGMVVFSAIFVNPVKTFAGDDLDPVKIQSVKYSSSSEAGALTFRWKKVAGAGGYQYRYHLFWKKGSKAGSFTKKTTKKNSVKIEFQDYGTVRFQIRPYRVIDGKKYFNSEDKSWTTYTLSKADMDRLVK